MNKQICLDCFQMFEQPAPHYIQQHNIEVDLIINVCPHCMSNHIEPIKGKTMILLDAAEHRHLLMVAQYFINGCRENLIRCSEMRTNLDAKTLHQHYQSLIQITELILKNAKQWEG